MNHARTRTFKAQPHQFVLWELVPEWYKLFPPDRYDLAGKMSDSTMLNKE